MTKERVVIAADHAGFDLKETLKQELQSMGAEVVDLGTNGPEAVDYPDFANALANVIGEGQITRGVLLCGSGIGASIAANRHRAVRAALCHNVESARMSRLHNDANVIVLGGRVTDASVAKACIRTFFSTEFEGGRHARRVAKLT